MQDFNTLELLDLFYQRFDSFQVLWTIYCTVVFGIIVALISFPKHLNSTLTRVILIIGFLAFTQANLGALLGVQNDRIDLLSELKNKNNCDPLEVITLSNYFDKRNDVSGGSNSVKSLICDKELQSKSLISRFHWFLDVLIVLLVWILPKSLIGLQLFKSISNLTVKIRGSNLPNPVISWHQGNRIWVLEEHVYVRIQVKDQSDSYQLHIPNSFTFDLATIPRLLWVLLAPFELSIIAPLVHDFLYEHKGNLYIDEGHQISSKKTDTPINISRLETDRIFLEHMKQEGVGKIKRYASYYGVRWFGNKYWKQSAK